MDSFVRMIAVYLCHSVMLFCLSKRKYSLKATVAIWSVLNLLAALISLAPLIGGIVTEKYTAAMFLTTMLLFSVVYLIVTEGSPLKKLFIFATYATNFVLVAIVAQYITDRFWNGSDYVYSLIRTVFFALFLVLLLKVIRPAFRRATDNLRYGWGAMAMLSVAFCVAVSLLAVFGIYNRENAGWYIAFNAALFFIMVTAYFVMYKMITSLNEESDKRQIQMQHKLLQSELNAEKEYVNNARNNRHDLRHHNRLLMEYLNSGDIDGAKEYLSCYDDMISGDALTFYCENSVVNAVLRMTARQCKASDMDFSADVEIPEELPLNQSETGSLFSNLLENACEACDKCSNPVLRVRSEKRGNILYIETENTVVSHTVFEGDLPKTTKQGGGTGIRSMKSVLDKHDGMLRCEQKDNRFFVQIILPL